MDRDSLKRSLVSLAKRYVVRETTYIIVHAQHTEDISSVGSKKLVSLTFTFSGGTKNGITFARSVLYC